MRSYNNHEIALGNTVWQLHFIILKLGFWMHGSWKCMLDFSRVSALASFLSLAILYVEEPLGA